MKVNVINNVPNVEVILNQSSDGSATLVVKEKMQKTLGQLKPGSIVKLGEREYIVLGHGTDTTAVITKDFVKIMEFGEKNNKYQTSKVREYCNTTFYNELVKAVGAKNIFKHKVRLTADDGTNKGIICFDNVSILTTELYRRYRQYLPAYDNWWWTVTPVSSTVKDYTRSVCPVSLTIKDYFRYVCCVSSSGMLGWHDCGFCCGVRPFCILNSSILI